MAAPGHPVQHDRGRSRDVEGRHPSVHRDPGQHIAPLAGQPGEAATLGAEHDCDPLAREIEIMHVGRAPLIETDGPDAEPPQPVERGRDSAHYRDGHVFDRPRRRHAFA